MKMNMKDALARLFHLTVFSAFDSPPHAQIPSYNIGILMLFAHASANLV